MYSHSHPLPEVKSLKTLATKVKHPNGNNLLHQFVLDYSRPNNSCVQNYINAALRCLSGISPNARNREGFTALHLAVRKRNYLMVKKLISCFPDIHVNDASDQDGRTALHEATLLLHGGNFSKGDYHTQHISTLPAEVVQEITNIIELLISSGAYLNACENDCNASPLRRAAILRNTPLHIAVQASEFEVVRILVERGAVVHLKNKEKDTPLHFAARRKQIETVEFLIDHGADVNAIGKYRRTPLHNAVEAGNLETVKVLVERGAVTNIRNSNNDTPLHSGVDRFLTGGLTRSQIDIVKFLVSSGADLNASGWKGYTPLHYAAFSECFDAVKILGESGALVDLKNNENDTPLHFAARRNQIETVEFLIDHGADVNATGNFGRTPLHYAVQFDRWKTKSLNTVKMLVARGAVIDYQGGYKCTPLAFANDPKIIEFLRSHGAASNDVKKSRPETPPQRTRNKRKGKSGRRSGIKTRKLAKN